MKFLVQGPFWPPLSTGDGRNGPTGFQKHFHTVCLGGTHPYYALGPLNGPLLCSRAPKTARFGPKRPFWGSQRDWKGPGGPDLVPTAVNWSDWVGIMVTTHFGLILGRFWAPKRTQIGPKFKIVTNLSCDYTNPAQEGQKFDKTKISVRH